MRLFAAIVPPEPALAELTTALPPLSSALRMVPAHQRHLTIAFYGEVPDPAVAELRERLGRAAARTAPMSLRLNGFGTFPTNSGRARVLWAGVDGEVAELTRLAERAVAAGRRVGLDVDARRYRPHLTVARARRDGVDVRDVIAAATLEGTTWTATEVVLIRSTLGSEVRHEPIETFPLGGLAPADADKPDPRHQREHADDEEIAAGETGEGQRRT